MTTLFVLADTTDQKTQTTEKTQLPLPQLKQVELTAESLQKELAQSTDENNLWSEHEITIPKNGSLARALQTLDINATTTHKIKTLPNSRLLTQLKVADKLQIWTDETGQLQKILYPKTRTHQVELTLKADGYQITEIHLPVEKRIVSTTGTINDSFYLSAERAGLTAKTIMNLADIFGWEIDFIRQLRQGDIFKVIYEKKYLDGEYIGDGKILAAEMMTEGKDKHYAYRLEDPTGKLVGYYDEKQKNLRKTFLRNPVDYVRITSRYTKRRFHPVQKKWKSHRGVDYGGPIGTPIRVTGNGKITKRYRSASYGNVIFVQHGNKYTTVYAHLNRFGRYRVGQTVRQGQVIGYLGRTGWATGPHLHYEFRENGRFKDPLRVKFPDSGPVPKKHQPAFAHYANLMSAQLDRISPQTQLAGHFE